MPAQPSELYFPYQPESDQFVAGVSTMPPTTTPTPKFTPAFGRLYYPDPGDLYYPMSANLDMFSRPTTNIWAPGTVLNQGTEGSCVGHAWAAWLMCTPIATFDGPKALEIYKAAQSIDPWRDEPHSGTTVRAAAEMMHRWGHIEQYVWARTAFEIAAWISQRGPVVLGTLWFESMYEPNPNGYIRMVGEPVGAHAYLAYGFEADTKHFICRNSWGDGYGLNGDFLIRYDDLDILLRGFGEACAAIEKVKR